jgi:hypothetical protein
LQTVTETQTMQKAKQMAMQRGRGRGMRGSLRVRTLKTVQTAAKRRKAVSRTSMKQTALWSMRR